MAENKEIKQENRIKLTKKDVHGAYYKWWLTCEISNSFERMQAVAVCASLSSVLKKLYPKKEDLKSALKRHLNFFNTEGMWGGMIHGTVIAMEEEKANGGDIPDNIITGVKTGLMGPLAGIGDTIDWGTLQTIFSALAISFGVSGSYFAPFLPVIFAVVMFFEGFYLWNLGYSLGKESVKQVLSGGWIQDLISGASVLGLFMMGALSANVVKLSIPLKYTISSGKEIIIQEILDKVVPGMLPLAAIFLVYWLIKYKKLSLTKVLLILLAVSLIGALIGIF